MDTDGFAARHVSLSNPKGDPAVETDLPLLLRRTADLVEELAIAPMELLDVVVHSTITENGPWWSTTIHWSRG